MPEQLVVRLDNLASAVEVDEVREVVASSGLNAEVRADWDRSQTGNGGFWLVLLELGQQSIPGFIGGLTLGLEGARREAAACSSFVAGTGRVGRT